MFVVGIFRDVTSLEFRRTEPLVDAARKMLRSEQFQLMLSVLREEVPVLERPAMGEMNESNLAFMAGRCYQHEMTLRSLLLLAEPFVFKRELVPTFPTPTQ